MKNNLISIDKIAKTKKKRLQTHKQFCDIVEFHSTFKQLSDYDEIILFVMGMATGIRIPFSFSVQIACRLYRLGRHSWFEVRYFGHINIKISNFIVDSSLIFLKFIS